MLKLVVAAAAAIAVVASPIAAIAQDGANTVALAKRYIEVAKLERHLDAVVGTMGPISARSLVRQLEIRPGSEDARIIDDLMADVGAATTRAMKPRFVEQMAKDYANTYSAEELEGLIAFYSTPLGRGITEKSPSLAPAPTEAMQAFLPEIDVEFERQLCKRIGCEAEPDAKPLKGA